MTTTTNPQLEPSRWNPTSRLVLESVLRQILERETGSRIALKIGLVAGVRITTTGDRAAAEKIREIVGRSPRLRFVSLTPIAANEADGTPAHYNILFAWK